MPLTEPMKPQLRTWFTLYVFLRNTSTNGDKLSYFTQDINIQIIMTIVISFSF